MVFSSLSFIFIFLPIFLILYYLFPKSFRNTILFIGSLMFYALGEPYYLFLIILSILVNYLFGILIDKNHILEKNKKKNRQNNKRQKRIQTTCLVLSLLYNFGMLIFFKYTNFFIDNVNVLLDALNINWQFYNVTITLPLGISFYTFQIVSYVIDVYNGKIKADKSFINLGAYLCMFPQLIAGPIVVYSDINKELSERKVSIENIDAGLKTFIIGLGYKVILANRIGTLWNEVCTIGFESISTPLAWLGALAYAMQLYFDFCGYSLMAIGLGKMIGFSMPANFNHPYISRSVTEFWRRWHITLGTWFKQYVYIPLGGNRKGKLRTIFNLFIVWFLVGFWHGAAWNFILWGLFIFLLQIIEKNITLKWLNLDNIFAKLISHIYMALYILVSWILFAISDFSQLIVYLQKMFPFFSTTNTFYLNDFAKQISIYGPLLALCVFFATDYPEKIITKLKLSRLSVAVSLIVFWYAVYFLGIGVNNPFLYFRF